MKAEIIDGFSIAQQVRRKAAEEVAALAKKGIVPCLAVVLVGDNPASVSYVTAKERALEEAGMVGRDIRLPEDTSESDVLDLIGDLNQDAGVHGILVQLPLPKHIDEDKVIMAIRPEKDVDGFHVQNAGKLLNGLNGVVACTPKGAMEMIRRTGVNLSGKEAVVVGRSNIVGKPMAMLLLHANGTVTVCHSRTKDLKEVTRRADILVVAIGRPKFVTEDMVKEGAVVIDVGVNRDPETKKLCGDVDFAAIEPKAAAITPVPGGVGPMTITCLMENTIECFLKSR